MNWRGIVLREMVFKVQTLAIFQVFPFYWIPSTKFYDVQSGKQNQYMLSTDWRLFYMAGSPYYK